MKRLFCRAMLLALGVYGVCLGSPMADYNELQAGSAREFCARILG